MSTEFAPPAILSAETPSKEWVDSVLASTPDSTPSKDIPGKFPETPPTKDELKQLEAQPRSDNQSKTAPTDKPSVGASVGDTIQSIKNTMSSYWSPEHTEEPHASLPSTELKGAQPLEHTGGVGALPGNVSESSVALLPDEREHINEERLFTSARQRGDTIKQPVSTGNDESREPEKEEKIPPGASPSKNGLSTSQPSDISDTDVESRKELSKAENQEVADQGKAVDVADSGAAGARADAEEPETTEESKLPSEELGLGQSTSQEDAGGKEEIRAMPTEKFEGGYGGDYHPAQLHPPPPGASAVEYQTLIGDNQQAAQDSPTTTGTKGESVGSEKKPRFMTMVKGEMKILAGKMSGDEQKVQEGKKLVHGET